MQEIISSSTSFNYPLGNAVLDVDALEDIYSTLTTCNTSTYLPLFYNSLIRLSTIDNTYKPRPIPF